MCKPIFFLYFDSITSSFLIDVLEFGDYNSPSHGNYIYYPAINSIFLSHTAELSHEGRPYIVITIRGNKVG